MTFFISISKPLRQAAFEAKKARSWCTRLSKKFGENLDPVIGRSNVKAIMQGMNRNPSSAQRVLRYLRNWQSPSHRPIKCLYADKLFLRSFPAGTVTWRDAPRNLWNDQGSDRRTTASRCNLARSSHDTDHLPTTQRLISVPSWPRFRDECKGREEHGQARSKHLTSLKSSLLTRPLGVISEWRAGRGVHVVPGCM